MFLFKNMKLVLQKYATSMNIYAYICRAKIKSIYQMIYLTSKFRLL